MAEPSVTATPVLGMVNLLAFWMHACKLQCAQRTHRCVSLLPICPIWLSTNLSMTHVQRRQRRRRLRGSGRSGAGDGASAEPGTGPSSVADSDPFGSDEEVCCEQIEAWIHEIVLCVKHWLFSLISTFTSRLRRTRWGRACRSAGRGRAQCPAASAPAPPAAALAWSSHWTAPGATGDIFLAVVMTHIDACLTASPAAPEPEGPRRSMPHKCN